MKQLLLIVISFCALHGLFAQRSYEEAILQGDAAFKKGVYKEALNYYFSAEAFNPAQKEAVRQKLNQVYDKIEAVRQGAEALEKQTKVSAEKLKAEQAVKDKTIVLLEGEKRRRDSLLELLSLEQAHTQKALEQVKIALEKYEKLAGSFYFYKDRFALAFQAGEFYFVDKEGNEVNKLGRWYDAEQFGENGLAKVRQYAGGQLLSYYIDSFGTQSRAIFDIQEFIESSDFFPRESFSGGATFGEASPCPPICGILVDSSDVIRILALHGPSEKLSVGLLFGEYFQKAKNLHLLELSGFDMTDLPPAIGQLVKLEELTLDGNQISQLPATIKNLKMLQSLNLSNNYLAELPVGFEEVTGLRELILTNNWFESVPKCISCLGELKVLDLSDNQLTALPDSIRRLTKISVLSLAANQFSDFPAQLQPLLTLASLNVSNNKIARLPEFIRGFKNLTDFDLSYNNLTELPVQIGDLTALNHLNLSGNRLTAIPAEVNSLKQLRTLNLNSNQLQSLPAELSGLKELTTLLLKDNPVQNLAEILQQLPNLKKLTLSKRLIPDKELQKVAKLNTGCKVFLE